MVKYIYDAWGNHAIVAENGEDIESGIGVLNPFRYRGYYYDTETELYFLQTRYYDPEVGRFISRDSIEYANPETINGLNLYAYCLNNPVINIDPNGTWSWKGFWNIVAAVVVVVAVTAAVVITAGAAAVAVGASSAVVTAVTVGAAIGGGIAGGSEVIRQVNEYGAENINLGSVAIESFAGSALGAIDAVAGTSTYSIIKEGAALLRIGVSGGTALLHGINEGKSFPEILGDVGASMAWSMMTQSVGLKIASRIASSNIKYGISKMLFTGLKVSLRSIWRMNKAKFGAAYDLVF